jgi:hypothetical protein
LAKEACTEEGKDCASAVLFPSSRSTSATQTPQNTAASARKADKVEPRESSLECPVALDLLFWGKQARKWTGCPMSPMACTRRSFRRRAGGRTQDAQQTLSSAAPFTPKQNVPFYSRRTRTLALARSYSGCSVSSSRSTLSLFRGLAPPLRSTCRDTSVRTQHSYPLDLPWTRPGYPDSKRAHGPTLPATSTYLER